jgi:hypothetical protein
MQGIDLGAGICTVSGGIQFFSCLKTDNCFLRGQLALRLIWKFIHKICVLHTLCVTFNQSYYNHQLVTRIK